MSEIGLSPDARRRLWQCYSLLLRLAEEAERNTDADSEACEGHETAAAAKTNDLTRLGDNTREAGLKEMEVENRE